MKEITSASLSYLEFPGLAKIEGLKHAVSLRGKNPQRNMSFSVSSEHGDPLESRKALLEALKLPFERLVVPGQVHSARVQLVTHQEAGRGAHGPSTVLSETDGLLTEESNLPLFVTAADCPPVFFWDPKKPAVALAHSGWRGTCSGIPAETLRQMREAFHTDPKDVRAAIGPGIGPCCYEVGDSLIDSLTQEDRSHLQKTTKGWVLDLPKWIAQQLQDEGVPAQSIEFAGLCTSCHREKFFSHRAEKGNTGRVAAVIALVGASKRN